MDLAGVIERLEHAVRVAGSPDAAPSELRLALKKTTQVQSFIAARRAELVQALDAVPTAFPEADIADTSGCSLGQATREKERADTLDQAAAVADALSDGDITPGHVDALTRAGKRLEESDRAELLDLDEKIVEAASTRSIAAFEKWLKAQERALDRRNDETRLEKQRRATRLRHWTDDEGMVNVRGRFDPLVGRDIARQIDAAADRLRAGELPSLAPGDPGEHFGFFQGLGLLELLGAGQPGSGIAAFPGLGVDAGAGGLEPVGGAAGGSPDSGDDEQAGSLGVAGDGGPGGRCTCGGRAGGFGNRARPGPPLVVIDASQSGGAGGPLLDWGYPVELPRSILAELAGTTDPDVVVVRNGVVLHAPGRLNLGRTSRVANRAQRRALAGLYSTCAVPGCSVHYDRCRLHHVIFWRNGGLTDLANLLPICQHHHTRLHEAGWEVTLGPHRELIIRYANGQVLRTGPPKRSAA